MSSLQNFLHYPIETLERVLLFRKRIDELNQAQKELFGPTLISLAGVQSSAQKTKGKRTMSPETRAKMAAAQKKRWTNMKKGNRAQDF